MGLLDRVLGGDGGVRGGVPGTAQVVSVSQNDGEATMQSCRMELVVQAPDVPATAVTFKGIVRAKKWPQPGQVLPVSVNPENPQSFSIRWNEIEESGVRARRSAEQMAAAMRGDDGASAGLGALGGLGGGAQVINLSGVDLSDLSEEKKAKLRSLGIDPDALAAQQGGAPAAASPAPAPDAAGDAVDERLARLERLADLHARGVLTDEEFATQKRRILRDG